MPLASSFFFWVALSVVAGVIVAVMAGGWNRLTTRRAKAEQAEAEEHERRAPVRAGLLAVAALTEEFQHPLFLLD